MKITMIAFLVFIIASTNSLANGYGNVMSTMAFVSAASANDAANTVKDRYESSQSEFYVSRGDIKAVVKCKITADGKCSVTTKFDCFHWYGCDYYKSDITFQELIINSTGHKDARVIGVNTYEGNLYVTWE